MVLNIHLAGIARDLSGKESIAIETNHTDKLNDVLEKAIPDLKSYYYAISINGKLSTDYSSLRNEDEILVFSPVAGG